MKKIKIHQIPIAPPDWQEKLNHRVRNDPDFVASGVESFAKSILNDMCASDGPVIGFDRAESNNASARQS